MHKIDLIQVEVNKVTRLCKKNEAQENLLRAILTYWWVKAAKQFWLTQFHDVLNRNALFPSQVVAGWEVEEAEH